MDMHHVVAHVCDSRTTQAGISSTQRDRGGARTTSARQTTTVVDTKAAVLLVYSVRSIQHRITGNPECLQVTLDQGFPTKWQTIHADATSDTADAA